MFPAAVANIPRSGDWKREIFAPYSDATYSDDISVIPRTDLFCLLRGVIDSGKKEALSCYAPTMLRKYADLATCQVNVTLAPGKRRCYISLHGAILVRLLKQFTSNSTVHWKMYKQSK